MRISRSKLRKTARSYQRKRTVNVRSYCRRKIGLRGLARREQQKRDMPF